MAVSNKQFNDLAARVTALEAAVANLVTKAEFGELGGYVNRMSNEVDEMSDDVVSLNERVAALEGGVPPPPVPVAAVIVEPSRATLNNGQSVQLSATARDENGNVLPGRAITWQSSDPAIATVDESGLVKVIGGA